MTFSPCCDTINYYKVFKKRLFVTRKKIHFYPRSITFLKNFYSIMSQPYYTIPIFALSTIFHNFKFSHKKRAQRLFFLFLIGFFAIQSFHVVGIFPHTLVLLQFQAVVPLFQSFFLVFGQFHRHFDKHADD